MTRHRSCAPRQWVFALTLGVLLLGVPGSAGPVGAQSGRRMDALSPEVRTALQQELSAAAREGLPTRPLESRVQEGLARGASGERILVVVRAHHEALRVARRALGSGSTESELDAGAAALRAGVDSAALGEIRLRRPTGTATTALVVLTDLVSRGVRPEVSVAAVREAARLDPSDAALAELQRAVAREAPSPDPAAAAAAVARFLRLSARPPANPLPP